MQVSFASEEETTALHKLLTITMFVLAPLPQLCRTANERISSFYAGPSASCYACMDRAYDAMWNDARKTVILRLPRKSTKSMQHTQYVKRSIKLSKEDS